MRKIMSYGSGGDGGSTSERAAEKKLLQVRRPQALSLSASKPTYGLVVLQAQVQECG